MFASEGARIAALDVDAAGLDTTAARVRKDGGEIETFVADVADEQQVREAIRAAVVRFARSTSSTTMRASSGETGTWACSRPTRPSGIA